MCNTVLSYLFNEVYKDLKEGELGLGWPSKVE